MTTVEEITSPTTPQAQLRLAWWGVVAVFLVHGLVVSTWVSRIAAVKTSLRLSDGDLGIALFGAAIGSVLAIPVSGWAASRYGSKIAVQCTAAGFALSLVCLAYAPNLASLFAALFLYGAMTGANDVAINAQAVAVEKRLGAPSMSRFHAMFSLGGIIGSAVGGLVASSGISPGVHFPVAAIVILAMVILSRPLLLDTHHKTAVPARMPFRKPPRSFIRPQRDWILHLPFGGSYSGLDRRLYTAGAEWR